MVSSISNSFILADAVSNIYTANSSAKLVKTAVDTYIKSSDSSDNIKEVINKVFNLYDDEDDENESLEFSIAYFLREYTKNTSDYIKSFAEQNKSNNIQDSMILNIGKEKEKYLNETKIIIKILK